MMMDEENHMDEPPSNDEQPSGPRSADPEQPASEPEDPNYPPKEEGGKIYIWLSILVVIIGVVVIVIMLTVVNDDSDNSPSGPAPTAAPSYTPTSIVSDPQERLSLLLTAVRKNPATSSYAGTSIPSNADNLVGKTTTSDDPVTQAASWLVRSDTYFVQEEIISRFVMAVLWYNNGGGKWTNRTNWMQASSVCGWAGVTCCKDFFPEIKPIDCVGNGRLDVTALDLHENNLVGTIPGAIALLDDCDTLWLSNNKVTGGLNSTIFNNMKNLASLYVQNNALSGGIDEKIRDNGQLVTLFTHGNNFTGVWPEQMCPQCVGLGICDSPPVAFTLDCKEMTCRDPFCCSDRTSPRYQCIADGDPDLP